ncbi:hypothetical protein Gpo141_00008127 [Globisporangium polare]
MFVPKTLLVLAATAAVMAPSAFAVETGDASLSSYVHKQPLLGEFECNNKTAYIIANSMFAEAETIWRSKGWTVVSNSSGILNEGTAVSGVFAAANVTMTRATAVVNAPAQTLFDYLITPKGYQLIDPGSNPDDFSKAPLEQYNTTHWRGKGTAEKRLEVSRTGAVIPGFTPREYVTLNGIDANTRLFVSKSVQHRDVPGCSIYGPASCNAISTNPVRALNTFAVQVEPVKGDASKCVVQLINYADFTAPEFSAPLMNSIVLPFLVDMVNRMEAYYSPTPAPTTSA